MRRQSATKPSVAGSEFGLILGISLRISSDINHDLLLEGIFHTCLSIFRVKLAPRVKKCTNHA